jgi:hypothetical protein
MQPMTGAGVHFSLFRGGDSPPAHGGRRRDIQELWFTLARTGWKSLVLVPADEGISAAAIATALAEVGGRLRDSPVTAIVAESMDYESARILADLQLRVRVEPRRVETVDVQATIITPPPEPATVDSADAVAEEPWPPPRPTRDARLMPPAGQVVVAIQPIVVEPLGVAIAQAADAVVLCIQIGRTRLKSARQTIALIGADRISGACLIR